VDIMLTGNASQAPVVAVQTLHEPVVGKIPAEMTVTSSGEITIGLTKEPGDFQHKRRVNA
jgi:hypothetical protein